MALSWQIHIFVYKAKERKARNAEGMRAGDIHIHGGVTTALFQTLSDSLLKFNCLFQSILTDSSLQHFSQLFCISAKATFDFQ
jgi:hypothetical protein